MKRKIIAFVSVVALPFSPAPLAAQDSAASQSNSKEEMTRELGAYFDTFGDLYDTAEPLTQEQMERVPAAQSVVAKLFPEGTYAKMMNESMTPLFESMMRQFGGSPAIAVGRLTGLSAVDLSNVDADNLDAALILLDPQATQRNQAMTDVTTDLLFNLMTDIEPAYRAGLTRAYATRFTVEELADLEAYFATPVGGKYAAESFLIFADPQVMSAMNEMMPAMLERMPSLIEGMEGIIAQFGEGRKFSDLDTGERQELAGLLNVSVEELGISEPLEDETF